MVPTPPESWRKESLRAGRRLGGRRQGVALPPSWLLSWDGLHGVRVSVTGIVLTALRTVRCAVRIGFPPLAASALRVSDCPAFFFFLAFFHFCLEFFFVFISLASPRPVGYRLATG